MSPDDAMKAHIEEQAMKLAAEKYPSAPEPVRPLKLNRHLRRAAKALGDPS